MHPETQFRQQQFLDTLLKLGDQLGAVFHLNVDQIVHPDRLQHLPPGSLGRELIEFLNREQLSPFTTGPRRKQLHDAVHVLTGYGTDLMGEAEVQSFLWGATAFPFHYWLQRQICRAIRRQGVWSEAELRERLHQAYQRGQRSHFNPATWAIETQWPLSIAQVQASLGVSPL
uniref:Uncharacterized protein n=1 Tax=Cyanothece sp. (strain PCC 7425 / ATCC 29141) TaxID=395961 RepID=B8HNY4_CYAP4